MADIGKLLESVERTHGDIQNVKTRITGVVGKLNQIKVAVATAIPSGGGGGQATVNTAYVKKELESAKASIAKFKAMIREAAESGVGAASGDVGFAAMKKRQQTDDKTKNLYERLGGDLNLETAVELTYNKALQDSRVRAYFEKNSRKMQNIRKKMHQFLSTILGGPKLYDDANLKPAHYHMNITDYHFDAILELFHQSFTELGVHTDAVTDGMAALGKVRKDVTTGCTVRMEMARKNNEKGRDALFGRLGQTEGIGQFMDRLYDLIAVDNRLKKFFQGKNMQSIKEGQRVYITELLGGPKTYKGRELEEIHKNLSIDDYYFDCFIMDAEKALSGLGIEDETIDEVLVTLEPIREPVLGRSRGLTTKHKLVDGKTVLERVGGEMNLEAVIETMYGGCVEDPRIKFFFLQNKEKITHIKRKMVQLLTGLCGGANTYDLKQLKPAHYHMNITDYQFDATCENLQYACEIMELEAPIILDLMEVVYRVRADITAGCTVRLEVARRKTELAGTEGLYAQIGGDDGMKKMMDMMYDNITQDERIKHFIAGSKVEAIKKSQMEFLAALFGGQDEYGGRDLKRVHAMIQINDYHFDSFLENAQKALRTIGLDSDSVDECTVLMETVRSDVVYEASRHHNVKKALEAQNRKSLHERMGGDQGFVKFIDMTYDKLVVDDRVRSFFEKNKAKIQSIKKKMVQLLVGLAGGNSTYDRDDLRPAHYAMNITDYHFDSALDIMQALLVEMEVKKSDARELISLLQPVRADVTTGCTVRMEMARRAMEKGKDQLYKRLGQQQGVQKLIDSLYEIMLNDPRIKGFLEGKADQIKAGQLGFITEMLGGPKVYKGRDLPAVHQNLGITDYHFDAFLLDFQRAMAGMGFEEGLQDEVLINLEPIRPDVILSSRNASAQAVTSKDGKPLIERLGGDMNLETIVELMYEKALNDSRVKFHFEKAKAKQRQIRQRMYQYLSGVFGGPVQYDAKNLRPMHYNMNVTDFHFDAVVEAFTQACRESECDADTVDDAMTVVGRVRPDITTGCTVRMELARKKNQKDGSDQLFARLGGLEGMDQLVSRLYECVERDKRINIFFEGAKLRIIKQSQTDYLIETLGGPSEYHGRTLEEIHATLAMNDYHFDCFMQSMQRALRDCGHDQETVDEVTVCLEQLRKRILKGHYEKMGYSVR